MFIKNIWYVAGWSSEVGAETLLDRMIAGDRLVFFRDTDGAVTALRNRCCHRAALLSMGTHESGSIRCGYHGMKFDNTGKCVEIPGQSKIPANAKVDHFPVTERYGWIWVWTGDVALADPALIPEMREMGDEKWAVMTGYLSYDTDYQLIHDNLLDFSHVSYVHAATLGGNPKWADELPEMKRLDNGFSIERWIEDVAPPVFIRSIVGEHVRQDIMSVYEMYINGTLAIDHSLQLTGTGTREKMAEKDFLRTMSWQAVTPAVDGKTHYFFSTALEKHLPSQILDILHHGTLMGFEEDRQMISSQQDNLRGDSEMQHISELATAHDRALLEMRRMIKRQIERELSNAKTARVA